MFYRKYIPPPPLSALVDCFWYSEGFEGTHQQERLLPNGESGIIFDLREEPIRIYDSADTAISTSFAPAIFCGARTDCFVIDTSAQERVLGIQFRPGGAYPILGMPASEVARAAYSLEDLWPHQTRLIRERLLAAPGVAAMFEILEGELLTRLKRGPAVHAAVHYASHWLARGVRVRDVADRAGLSSRRLIDLFAQQTGLAPKAFQRVRRFQRVLRSLHTGREELWADLAASCGYYDQAHFIHDFRDFSGMTPGEYMRVATPHMNHVPLQ